MTAPDLAGGGLRKPICLLRDPSLENRYERP